MRPEANEGMNETFNERYIYFNEKHCILIYYCLLIFSFQFFIIRNFI